MNRRSFGATAAVWLAAMCGLPKLKAKSEITVHGPEVIVVHDGHNIPIDKGTVVELPAGYNLYQPRPTLSLRFENVPLRENESVQELLCRLLPLFGTINRSDWHWHGDVERAGTLMFTSVGMRSSGNGVCSVVCAFTCASSWRPWPGSHRPVDFETEIPKVLAAR